MAEVVRCVEDISALQDNVICGGVPVFGSYHIEFAGTGNCLFVEDGTRLGNSRIRFAGSNALVILRKSRHPYALDLTSWSNTTVCFDRNTYFNGLLHLIASEGKSVVVGRDCIFSFDIWIRTADPHLVYDATSRQRINLSTSVLVGDHVWVGQGVTLLKGSVVGSGSVIGAQALIAGKKLPSNTVWAGNPARLLRSNIFWDGRSVHDWGGSETAASLTFKDDRHVFRHSSSTIDIHGFLDRIDPDADTEERLRYLKEQLFTSDRQSRFFIADDRTGKKEKRGRSHGFFHH